MPRPRPNPSGRIEAMLTRRQFLVGAGAGAGAAASLASAPVQALAREPQPLSDDAVGILYDSTLCIGCQACVSACRVANDVHLAHVPEIGRASCRERVCPYV